MRKNNIIQRLNIIQGQINGLMNLIKKDTDCQKVTEQLYAVNSGIKKVAEAYFRENLSSCLDSVDQQTQKNIDYLLKQIFKNK